MSWNNIDFEASSSTQLSDARDAISAVKFSDISSPLITNVDVTSEAVVTSTSSDDTGAQYHGIWWDQITLQTSTVTNVNLESTGVAHSNVALLSASVFWDDVAFIDTTVSTLSVSTTSSTNVGGGEAAGIYFRDTRYTDSLLDVVTLETDGGCLGGERCAGVVINGSQFSSSTLTNWTVLSKGNIAGENEAVGVKFSEFAWSGGDLGRFNVEVESDSSSNSTATGIEWVLYFHFFLYFLFLSLPLIMNSPLFLLTTPIRSQTFTAM